MGKLLQIGRRRLVTLALAVTIGATGAYSLSAAPTAGNVASAARSTISTVVNVADTAPSTSGQSLAVSSTTAGTAVVQHGWLDFVVSIVLRYSGVAWSTLRWIVSGGWTRFISWWNGLSGWARWLITNVIGAGVGDIFNWLWHYFFG